MKITPPPVAATTTTGLPPIYADPCGGMAIFAVAFASDGFYYLAFWANDANWIFNCGLTAGPYDNDAITGGFGSTSGEGVGVATGATASTEATP